MADIEIKGVSGRRILITGGATREGIDGVRHYANSYRRPGHGLAVAVALARAGASVTLATTRNRLPVPDGVTVVSTLPDGRPILTAADLAEVAAALGAEHSFDTAMNLAVAPSMRAAAQVEHKLKVKSAAGALVSLDVSANIDILAALRAAAPGIPVGGYGPRQELFAPVALPGDLLGLTSALEKGTDERTPVRAPAPRETDLAGMKVVVSSGPTAEPLTPWGDVITNFSSGLQGVEVACSLADRGAEVVLVTGPVSLADPAHPSIHTIRVGSAREMLDACLAALPADAYVGIAAVADFGISEPGDITFGVGGTVTLALAQNPDILHAMGHHPASRPRVVVGFAAETRDLEIYARGKLERKGADVIFGNLVGAAASARGSGRNRVLRVTAADAIDMGETDKYEVGLMVGDFIRDRA